MCRIIAENCVLIKNKIAYYLSKDLWTSGGRHRSFCGFEGCIMMVILLTEVREIELEILGAIVPNR